MELSNTSKNDVPGIVHSESDSTISNEQPEKWWKTLKIELFFILHLIGSSLQNTVRANLYMDRVCAVNFNQSKGICDNLTVHQNLLDRVQSEANFMIVYRQLMILLPSLIFTLYSGPFSDKYGRKPLITLAAFGEVVYSLTALFLIYWDTLRVEYFLLCSVASGLTGGSIAMNGNLYSMIADSSSRSSRTLRFAVFQMVTMMAEPVASTIAGQVWKHFGYLPVFASALALNILAMGFFVFFIEELRKNLSTFTWKTVLSNICHLESLKENYRVCRMKRENQGRTQIWMIFVAKLSLYIGKTGISHSIFFFVGKLYGWDLERYTLVTNGFKFANIFIVVLILPLLIKVYKIRDSCLGLISMFLLTAQSIGRAFAYETWIFYATSILESNLPDVCNTVLGSKISKLVPHNELGKIFAMIAIIEELTPSVSTFMFAKIYSSTLDIFPGMVFILASAFFATAFGIFIWFLRIKEDANASSDQIKTTRET